MESAGRCIDTEIPTGVMSDPLRLVGAGTKADHGTLFLGVNFEHRSIDRLKGESRIVNCIALSFAASINCRGSLNKSYNPIIFDTNEIYLIESSY